jgi:cation transport ATPase-like protein
VRLIGLGQSEAQARLAAEGPNEPPQPDRRTPLRIVLEVLREPMFALLIGGGVIYLLLGDDPVVTARKMLFGIVNRCELIAALERRLSLDEEGGQGVMRALRGNFSLPELEAKLDELPEGTLFQISDAGLQAAVWRRHRLRRGTAIR